MGIRYVDSVVVYNRYVSGLIETEQYFGTRFDNVRIELTQRVNQQISGMENAGACVVKIPNRDLPKPYKPPKVWLKQTTEEMLATFTLDTENNFFIIAKKEELGIDVDAPVGKINSEEYGDGFMEHLKGKYGYVFSIDTADVYQLIPRFEIGGS